MIGTIVNVHERDSRDKKAGSGKDPSTARLNIRLLGRGPVKETLSQAVSAIRGAVKRVGQVLVSGRPMWRAFPVPGWKPSASCSSSPGMSPRPSPFWSCPRRTPS